MKQNIIAVKVPDENGNMIDSWDYYAQQKAGEAKKESDIENGESMWMSYEELYKEHLITGRHENVFGKNSNLQCH